ncbi:TetR family transcriptional regulator [Nocardiopsis sp. RSe5-2]|uniref:TetR family transcriptional regulator n=1 Tax=Nocardiopsis endophytica TaxID=3018445 RepID=A0ABT4U0W7_9ACTN|nr:TetR family transcriptional regulator [Nocardiopsis endophytica]MDA2810125.1 TetR family transcriptional regulator [Nocardiopsis endophytica]
MPRDAAATRARLLAAARDEFAEHGIGGARVERIAQRAGVNKERIYGHFGNKDALFEAVMVDALSEHTEGIGLPSGDVAEYAGRLYDYHRRNPQLLRLLMWESLHYGEEAELPGREDRKAHYATKVDALAKLLGTGADRRTTSMLMVVIGLAAWPSILPQLNRLISDVSEDDLPEEDVDAAMRETIVDVVRKATEDRGGAD